MEWIAVVLAFSAVTYFCIISRSFRRIMLGILALAAVVGVIGGIYAYVEQVRSTKKRAIEASLITSSDLEFSQMNAKRPAYSSYWDVTGVVKNNSSHEVKELTLTVTISNCDDTNTNCTIVGSDDATDWVVIPPGQARQMKLLAGFDNLPTLENWRWQYSVKSIVAEDVLGKNEGN